MSVVSPNKNYFNKNKKANYLLKLPIRNQKGLYMSKLHCKMAQPKKKLSLYNLA